MSGHQTVCLRTRTSPHAIYALAAAPAHDSSLNDGSQKLARPLHQRGGAPWVRSRATIYVSGVAGPPHVKIFRVPDCLFCGIAAADIPATIVSANPRTVAFRDINPQAPVHVLVITRDHHANLAELAAAGDGLLADLVAHAHEVAVAEGIAESGYRVVFNTGAESGQTVNHVHAHVLGGRPMTWPPG
jgi:histidine triad (HIT) family protein